MEAHFLRSRSSSMTLGTKMAWIRLGDRDKLIEDGLDCSMMTHSAEMSEIPFQAANCLSY